MNNATNSKKVNNLVTKNLPEPMFYSVELLAEKWGCSQHAVLHRGFIGELKLSVLSEGWFIERSNIEQHKEADGGVRIEFVGTTRRYSNGELLPLSLNSVRALIKNGSIKNPDFDCEDGYDQVDVFSTSIAQARKEIVIKVSDVFIDKKDAVFPAENTTQETLKNAPGRRNDTDKIRKEYERRRAGNELCGKWEDECNSLFIWSNKICQPKTIRQTVIQKGEYDEDCKTHRAASQ